MTPLDRLKAHPVVAVVRAPQPELLVPLAGALLEGGVEAIEVTTTTPRAVEALGWVVKEYGNRVLAGLGTTLDPSLVAPAVEAGAQFIVSPVLHLEVLAECQKRSVLCAPGCFSPTEAWRAHQEGAELIKIFPATRLGPSFIKDLLAPMPFLRLMPTGGVEPENAADWLKAGAWCLGAGSSLVPRSDLESQNWTAITERARSFTALLG